MAFHPFASLAALAAVLTAGAGAPPALDEAGTLAVRGVPRQYVVHWPARSAAGGLPLLVALHGYGQTPAELEAETGLSRLADEAGFAVAYPTGLGLAWNDGREDARTPDVAFVARLLDRLESSGRVDLHRVSVVGSPTAR